MSWQPHGIIKATGRSWSTLLTRNTNDNGTPNTSHKYNNKLVVHDLSPTVVQQIHEELDHKWNRELETAVHLLENFLHPTLVPLMLDYLIIPKELYSGNLSLLETDNRFEAKCYYFDESRLHLAPDPHQATGTVPQGVIVSLIDLNERGLWRRQKKHDSVTSATFKIIRPFGHDLVLSSFDNQCFTTSSCILDFLGSNVSYAPRTYNIFADVTFTFVKGRWFHEITSEFEAGTTIKKTTFYWILERVHTEVLLEDPPRRYGGCTGDAY
jgi:hypothetical protein